MALCRDFVVRGAPVSSRQLHEAHGLAWSPATIRNELKALEVAGMVHKAHSASGRVPTTAGLRLFVDALERTGPASPEEAVRRAFEATLVGARDAARRVTTTARLLSDLSGHVAIAFFGQPREPIIDKVELIGVAVGRALLVTSTRAGDRDVRRVEIDTELVRGVDELDRLAAQLSDLVVGRTLAQARADLLELVQAREAELDAHLAAAARLGLALCAGLAHDPLWLEVAGQPSLAAHEIDGGSSKVSLARTLAALEDYQRLAHLLCQLLPEGRREPSVSLGLDPGLVSEGAIAPSGGLSLVGCRVAPALARALSGAQTGVVAVLGPPQMDYARLIPLVEYAAHAVAQRG